MQIWIFLKRFNIASTLLTKCFTQILMYARYNSSFLSKRHSFLHALFFKDFGLNFLRVFLRICAHFGLNSFRHSNPKNWNIIFWCILLVFIVVYSRLHFTSIFIRNICYGSLLYPFFCELLVKYCDGNRLMYGKWILKYLWWIRGWYILYFSL